MERNVDGYHFSCDEDGKRAKDELQKINLISEKLNKNNPEAILLVYNKCIQSNMFITPIGIDFLKTLQTYLRKVETINSEDILDIPIRISYEDALELRANNRYRSIDNQEKKNYAREFRFSLFFNGVLIALIIAMFAIILNAKNPNVLNYQTAITNEYADWQQQLDEKEQELKERERTLKEREEQSN